MIKDIFIAIWLVIGSVYLFRFILNIILILIVVIALFLIGSDKMEK